MTPYLEQQYALYAHLSSAHILLDHRIIYCPYRDMGLRPQGNFLAAPQRPLPSGSHQCFLVPPKQYLHLQHQQAPRSHLSCPYNNYHLPFIQYPRALSPSFSSGTWSKDRFIEVISHVLDAAAELNNNFVGTVNHTGPETLYFSVSRPDISTKLYIRRLITYARCSPAAFVVMLIYIDRIATANRSLLVTPYNMHRLLITALTLASKYLDDRCCSNVHFAKMGGVQTVHEMNRLEIQYLKFIDFRLHVEFDDYMQKLTSLMKIPLPASPAFPTLSVTPAHSARNSVTTSMEQRNLERERRERLIIHRGVANGWNATWYL